MGTLTECLPSRETMSRYFDYDKDTGLFRWKVSIGRVKPGDIAGTKTPQGHLVIRLANSTYMAHRLAWLFATGHWPHRVVRHRNGDPTDNRFANLVVLEPLRERDQHRKELGSRAHGRFMPHGVFDVYFPRLDITLYQANAMMNGESVFLGRFETEEEAKAAFTNATGQTVVPTNIR